MTLQDRFLQYVRIHSASAEDQSQTPSTACQFDMTSVLCEHMHAMGMQRVYGDEHAYAYGYLPATEGCEDRPCIGLISHLDTIPGFSGQHVKPQIIKNYDGGDVPLGNSGRTLTVEMFPHLPQLRGETLITTDGTTVLGADDKAGITVILSACQTLIEEKRPHGPISVCFTPDEEIGHGASLLDLDRFGAAFAYTIDGREPNVINYETFNAAEANWQINGVSVHPGRAKNTMINASLVAMEINALLPGAEIPALTEGYEGYFHLTHMQGDIEHASLGYIVRDHDAGCFEARKRALRMIEKTINEKYGAGTAALTIRDQYRNMAEILAKRPEAVQLAERAIRRMGMEPQSQPIRGGTDGSQLSYRGLPCPNLGCGGYAAHGPYEHVTVENMQRCTEVVLHIIDENLK